MGIGSTGRVYEHDNVYESELPIFTIYSEPELPQEARTTTIGLQSHRLPDRKLWI